MRRLPEIEEKSFKGSFFSPNCPDEIITGTLVIFTDGSANLEILGAFKNDGFLQKRSLITLLGILFNGDKVSLLDSYRGKGVYASDGALVNYSVGTTFIGTHILSRNDEIFKTISAEIDYLQEWVDIDGGDLQISLDLKEATYRYRQPEDINFIIDDNISGAIYFRNEFWGHSEFGNEFKQRTRLHLEAKADVSASELIKNLLNFRKLVSIFIGQKVRILKIVMESEHEKIKVLSPNPSRRLPLKEIQVYFNDKQLYTPLPDHPIVFVKYADISDDFAVIVKNWYQMLETQLLPVTYILLDALANHHVFDESDFIRTWQGVEAFHRLILQDTTTLKAAYKKKMAKLKLMIIDDDLKEWVIKALAFAYEPPAKERLSEIIHNYKHLLPFPITDNEIEVWVKEMGNTRNYLTHFDPAGANKKVSGKRLYNYTCLLKLLLLLSMLTRLGVREELLKDLSSHQNLSINNLANDKLKQIHK